MFAEVDGGMETYPEICYCYCCWCTTYCNNACARGCVIDLLLFNYVGQNSITEFDMQIDDAVMFETS